MSMLICLPTAITFSIFDLSCTPSVPQ
uniref:Uncharacterized protein n=1 Tax=Arundo donax TaxID=35708 RepID=A0A0A9EHU2_ARUDO